MWETKGSVLKKLRNTVLYYYSELLVEFIQNTVVLHASAATRPVALRPSPVTSCTQISLRPRFISPYTPEM